MKLDPDIIEHLKNNKLLKILFVILCVSTCGIAFIVIPLYMLGKI